MGIKLTNVKILDLEIKRIDYLQICKNIKKNHKDIYDLYQISCLNILKMNNDKLNELYTNKTFKYYFIIVIKNQIVNKYSEFNKAYSNYENTRDYNYNLDDIENTRDVDYINRLDNNFYKKIIDIEDDNNSIRILHNIKLIEDILIDMNNWNKDIYDWYNRELFIMYYKLLDYNKDFGNRRDKYDTRDISSYRRLEKLTGINYCSIRETVKKVENYIKNIIDKQNN